MSDTNNEPSSPGPTHSGTTPSISMFSEHVLANDDQAEPSKRVKLDNTPPADDGSHTSSSLPSTSCLPPPELPRITDHAIPPQNGHELDSQPVASGSGTSVAKNYSEQGTCSSPPASAEELVFTWKDSNFRVALDDVVTIGDLKVVVYSVTAVPPERQKIIGLVPGKIPGDDVHLSTIDFKMKRGAHFMLLGTPEEDTILRPPGPFPSLEHPDPHAARKAHAAQDCVLYLPRVQAKLDELTRNLEINIMNPPRAGKKLLVLDLDYTLMDSKAYSDYSVHALDMARPYLHEFLTALWPYYDICIWSATSWRWLESKLVELGMVAGRYTDKYLIQFVLDRGPMFEVTSMRHGKVSQHEVKALELIWRKIPAYNATNTVHLDDLSRNFVLNPRSGVKISAFKNARENKHDRQLVFLAKYFLQIALLPDVRTVDHRKWADCQLPLPPGAQDPIESLDPLDPEVVKFNKRRLHKHPKRE